MDRKLGTFYGVFTPTLLTILGVIMYLRFGWLVGNLGLAKVIPIVLLANMITLITTLSFSAVASNTQIGAGGAYYVISRSLGIEIGGAIGLPLFLSQAFSVTLYAYGLAESLRFVWPDLPLQAVTLAVILAVGAAGLSRGRKGPEGPVAAAAAGVPVDPRPGDRRPDRTPRSMPFPWAADRGRSVSGRDSRCSFRRSPGSWPGSACPAT